MKNRHVEEGRGEKRGFVLKLLRLRGKKKCWSSLAQSGRGAVKILKSVYHLVFTMYQGSDKYRFQQDRIQQIKVYSY